MEKVSTEPKNNSHRIIMATLNVNGLYAFRQDNRTRLLLRPYPVRFKALGKLIEASVINIINFQEVFTHRQRKLLEASLPSFGCSTYESGVTGPKGALVTFSRLPIEKDHYESFRSASQRADCSGLPPFALAKSGLKGVLVSRLQGTSLAIVNTHPLANDDWDWSPGNRFYSLEEAQLGEVAKVVKNLRENNLEVVLGADLNVAKSSTLFREFVGKTGLRDVFDGDTLPTFHDEFVAGDRSPECIDYLLAEEPVAFSGPHKLFENKVAVDGEGEMYLTDHQGLCAELVFDAN